MWRKLIPAVCLLIGANASASIVRVTGTGTFNSAAVGNTPLYQPNASFQFSYLTNPDAPTTAYTSSYSLNGSPVLLQTSPRPGVGTFQNSLVQVVGYGRGGVTVDLLDSAPFGGSIPSVASSMA